MINGTARNKLAEYIHEAQLASHYNNTIMADRNGSGKFSTRESIFKFSLYPKCHLIEVIGTKRASYPALQKQYFHLNKALWTLSTLIDTHCINKGVQC